MIVWPSCPGPGSSIACGGSRTHRQEHVGRGSGVINNFGTTFGLVLPVGIARGLAGSGSTTTFSPAFTSDGTCAGTSATRRSPGTRSPGNPYLHTDPFLLWCD